MITEKILNYFQNVEKKREWSNNVFRASSSGKCARALAYQRLEYEAEPLSARARMVFRMGDLVEQDMVNACEAVECLTDMQKEANFILPNGQEVTGHIDGITEFNGEKIVVDFKSISMFGFMRAEKGELDYSYKCQATCYMKALDLKKFLFLFYNKNTSHVTEILYQWDEKILNEVVDRFTRVGQATKENLPNKDYGPNAKGDLPYQCSYCAYANVCQTDYELIFEKGKPKLRRRK